MQKVLTKYWLAVHVGLLWFVAWYGVSQPRGFGHRPLLWLAVLTVEALVLLPSVRKGETLSDARSRVGHAVLHDPFTYLGLAVISMAVVQWLNSGCVLVYLSDADVWQFSRPPVTWLPFSIDPKAALANVSVLSACIVAGVVLRQGVNRAGKRFLLQAAAAVSGAVAVLLVWRASAGVAPYAALASDPPACNPGSFFGFWLLMGMGAYVDALSRRQRATELLFSLGFIGNLIGMLFFASALAILAYGFAALLLVIYWMLFLGLHHSRPVQIKLFLITLVVCASTVLAITYVFPGNPVVGKMKSLAAWGQQWHALTVDRETRMSAVLKIWKEHPWVGVGADGFFHHVGTVMQGKDWAVIRRDQAFVRNDCLQYLCEYGALGVGLLLAVVACLVGPVCYRLRLAWQEGAVGETESRMLLFRLSPLVVTGILATALCFAESWLASPFHSPAVLASWFFVMAMIPAFLPATATGSK